MIYTDDICNLIHQWQLRSQQFKSNSDYAIAIQECIFELNNLLFESTKEDMEYQDFLETEADNYLSSMEAHEQYAA